MRRHHPLQLTTACHRHAATALMLLLCALACPARTVVRLAADSSRVGRSFLIYPRTNLLLPLLNVGAELPLSRRWSVGADWYYPWMARGGSHRSCFQLDGLSLEGRYWLSAARTGADARAADAGRLLGHAVGLFTMGGRYDLERHYHGHQGRYALGGVDYLFARPVCGGRMHLELSLGVGFLYSRATAYDVFVRGGKGYRDKNFRQVYRYFGPLKANVSLVVPLRIGRTNKNAEP